MARISPDKDDAATAIAPLLADSENIVSEEAGKQLLQLGACALPLIVQTLHSDQPAVRLKATRLLRQTYSFSLQSRTWIVAAAEVNEAIRSAINDPDPAVRMEAIGAAAERGQATAEEISALWQSGGSANLELALTAVCGLGDAATQFLPVMLALLDDKWTWELNIRKNPSMRSRLDLMLGALSAMKTGARPATERLVAIGKKRGDEALSIARTLHEIGAADANVASVLQPLLWSTDKKKSGPPVNCWSRSGRMKLANKSRC